MIARRRGAHHGQERWQPRSTTVATPKPSASASATKSTPLPARAADVEHIAQKAATAAFAEFVAASAAHTTSERSTRRRRSRARTTLLMLAVAIGLFAVSTAQQIAGARRDAARLPATPGQWVDAYEAAAIDNPSRVCTQLLSPQLAAAYAAAVHSGCTTYFARIRSTSLRVRRVLRNGSTAVVELRQTIEKTDWNVVLDQRGTGWQAVDLVPGRPLR